MDVKEIAFKNQKNGASHLDVVELGDIINKNHEDHNQFEHHKLSFYVIIIMTDGNGKHSINYKDYYFKKGTVFTLRKGNIHQFYKSNTQGKLLIFTENFIPFYAEKSEMKNLFRLFNEMLASPKLQLNSEEFIEVELLLQQIENEILTVGDYHSDEIIKNIIQIMIHKLFRIKNKKGLNRSDTKYHSSFNSLQELVEKDCFKSKTVSYYARKMGVTSRTLNNVTQSVIGKSAKAFIDQVLILHVKRLIINSSLSLTEIAYESGFNQPTNFFKFFRKNTGLSPKEFREKIQ